MIDDVKHFSMCRMLFKIKITMNFWVNYLSFYSEEPE